MALSELCFLCWDSVCSAGEFGSVLNIICGSEWRFDGGFLVEEQTAVGCYHVVFSGVATMREGGVEEGCLTRCHSVLEH